jgi:hypothetical protein
MNIRASDFYESEAEGKRESLAGTLAALHDRLTVGQVVDEVLTYAKGTSGTFRIAMTNAARDNPLPTLLIGTACALLMADKTGLSNRLTASLKRTSTEDEQPFSEVAHPSESGMLERARATVSNTAGAAAQGARETIHDARDRISGSITAVSDTASAAKGQIDELTEQAVRVADQARNKTARVFQEQPLLLAGLGIALGAVVAFLLPRSRIEDRLMGESSDAVRGQVSNTLSQQMDEAKSVAQAVVEEVKVRIEEEGLTSGTVAAEAVRDLAGEQSPETHDQPLNQREPVRG